jgi:hypothetical protein
VNREERLRRELAGTGLEGQAGQLAGLPTAQVGLIVRALRASHRAGREHEKQARRQRNADRRKYGRYDVDQVADALDQRTIHGLGRRAGVSLEALARLDEHYADGSQVLAMAVDGLRARGYSWGLIGAALGTTRQAAWERFHRQADLDTGTAGTAGVPGSVGAA